MKSISSITVRGMISAAVLMAACSAPPEGTDLREAYLGDLKAGRFDAAYRKTTLTKGGSNVNAALSPAHFKAYWSRQGIQSYSISGRWVELELEAGRQRLSLPIIRDRIAVTPREALVYLSGGPAPGLAIDGVPVRATHEIGRAANRPRLHLLDGPRDRFYRITLLPGDHLLSVEEGPASAAVSIAIAKDEREMIVRLSPSRNGRQKAIARAEAWVGERCGASCRLAECGRPSRVEDVRLRRDQPGVEMFDSLYSRPKHTTPEGGWTVSLRRRGKLGNQTVSVIWLVDFLKKGSRAVAIACWAT